MPSHVSHAENFLEAAHCVSQTGRMLLPSEYISGCWGCRWCSRCSQHQHRVPVGCQKSQHIELRISTGQNRLSSLILLHFEREILWTKPFIVIWTRWSIPLLPSMEDQTTFSQLLFCDHLSLVLPSSQQTVVDQCQEVGQLVGKVLSLLHCHGHYQKHLSSHHKLSPLLHGAHKFNRWHNQEYSRFNTTSPFTRIHWDRTTVHVILRGYFLWSSRVPNTKSKIATGTIAASTDYLIFFSFPWRSGNVSIN